MVNSARKKLALIDVSSFLHRYWNGFPDRLVNGVNVNAIHGFAGLVKSFQTSKDATHLVACVDSESSVRKVMFPDYKSGREQPAENMLWQAGVIRSLFEFMEVPVVSCDGWEADDVIATVAKRAVGRFIPVTVYSEDFDLHQLLKWSSVEQQRAKELVTECVLRDRIGIRPEQVPDYQAMKGGSVPGVDGVGKKTAAELLAKYGTLDGVYGALSELTPAKREAFEVNAVRLLAMRSLCVLRDDLPVARVGSAAEISLIDPRPFLDRLPDLMECRNE